MTNPRADYIKCIRRNHAAHKGESWCGRQLVAEFAFDGVDHAAENGKQEGRLVACPECVAAVNKALANGHAVETSVR